MCLRCAGAGANLAQFLTALWPPVAARLACDVTGRSRRPPPRHCWRVPSDMVRAYLGVGEACAVPGCCGAATAGEAFAAGALAQQAGEQRIVMPRRRRPSSSAALPSPLLHGHERAAARVLDVRRTWACWSAPHEHAPAAAGRAAGRFQLAMVVRWAYGSEVTISSQAQPKVCTS